MEHITNVLSFLRELSNNNNQTWFHAHKKEYDQAKHSYLVLLERLIGRIRYFDPSIPKLDVKDVIFKIHRDTRFSNDKSPYHVSFRAHIAPHGKAPIPCGYFICIQPNDNTIAGGGIFMDHMKEVTKRIRDAIQEHTEVFQQIIEAKPFKEQYQVLGYKLKNVPKGYETCTQSEYMKHKSWFIEHAVDDFLLVSDDVFIEIMVALCEIMKPFNDFLNCALNGYKLPQR